MKNQPRNKETNKVLNLKETGLMPPVIEIFSPDLTEPIYSREINLSGLVTYTGGVLSDLQMMVAGFDIPISPDGLWQTTVLLSLGANQIIIEASDRIIPSNSTRLELEITRLVIPPPEVVINTPTNNWETTEPDVIVSGTAFAYGEPENTITRLEVNGVPVAPLQLHQWNINFVPLNLGENIIEAIVFDMEGNSGRAEVNVFRTELSR